MPHSNTQQEHYFEIYSHKIKTMVRLKMAVIKSNVIYGKNVFGPFVEEK